MAEKRKYRLPEEAESAWKKTKFDYRETVYVAVGPRKQQFMVYKDVIIQRSQFFASACSDKWKREEAIDLTLHKPDTFASYLQCLYQSTISTSGGPKCSLGDLIELYYLADEIGDLRTANKTIDKIIEQCYILWADEDIISNVYENTTESSPLRRLMVDYAMFHAYEDAVETELVPRAFLADCFRRFCAFGVKNRDKDTPGNHALSKAGFLSFRDPKLYHQHDRSGHVFCCLQVDK